MRRRVGIYIVGNENGSSTGGPRFAVHKNG